MAFVKNEQYFERKIENIKIAIMRTNDDIAKHKTSGNDRALAAHESYLSSCLQELDKARAEFQKWLKK